MPRPLASTRTFGPYATIKTYDDQERNNGDARVSL